MDLLSAPLDKYDYMMAAALLSGIAAVMAVILFLMGLPGRIAIKRGHPHAEAVRLMGWMGFLAVVPWVHAFMWAFHDSATVDIRRLPDEEREHVRKEIARLSGKPADSGETPPPAAPDAAPRT